MIVATFAGVTILGYLLGSVPSGYIIGKILGKGDVRQYGSGKIGVTNLLRTVGIKGAIVGALLDIFKAVLAVVFAGIIINSSTITVNGTILGKPFGEMLAASAAIVGHIWPVYIKFRGGRGVATFFGGMLILCPVAGLSSGFILLLTIALTRYASLGSIVGSIGSYVILIALVILRGYRVEYLAFALFGAVLITVVHHDNIARLISGKERKIGQKAEKNG